jgi:hypothetical protein
MINDQGLESKQPTGRSEDRGDDDGKPEEASAPELTTKLASTPESLNHVAEPTEVSRTAKPAAESMPPAVEVRVPASVVTSTRLRGRDALGVGGLLGVLLGGVAGAGSRR